MKKIRVILTFVCAILTFILCNSCSSTNTNREYVSLWDHYEKLLDSLNKQPNDFIIYYQDGINLQKDEEIIYTLINYNDRIEISKIYNNSLMTKKKYIKDFLYGKIFGDIEKLVDTNITIGPIVSHFPHHDLNLRIKNLVYYYQASVEFYDIPAMNFIKAILLDAENDKTEWE